MKDRSEFYDEAGWAAHLERELEAAQIRGDVKEGKAVERELAKLAGQRGASKRPRKAGDVEERA